jgi:hypothetical protein
MSFATGGVKGSQKLLTIGTARTLNPGQFTIGTGVNFYTKAFSGGGGQIDFASFNFWQLDGDVSFSYGISNMFDVSLNTRMYQDSHHNDGDPNLPAYVDLDLKFGNIELGSKSFYFAGNLGLEFGIASYDNVPYEDYVSSGITIKPDFIFSYFTDKFLPDDAISIHAHLGFDIHLDNGNEILNPHTNEVYKGEVVAGKRISAVITENTMKFNYGFGVSIPTEVIDILVELDGYSFLTEPSSVYINARESRMVANLGFRYKLSPFLSFDFGFGFNIAEGAESTYGIGQTTVLNKDADFSGYSSWRGFLGLNFSLQPSGSYGVSKYEIERNEYQRKIQTFKTLIEEQENSELIEQELESLKQEREKAEKELEELKKILED